ncbi:ABC transporter permease [Hansschlegelia quercus]|uniref:ABC transporter permease subunit n=1 Tax=Hansschlegelia quercus TaxID=2528245 RepID=A0A4Q9GKS2_9HYPH|nr:ABC transporter permease subunit [Hansschlegelia quercus]TBN54812.1 ABC transporter permease subunit [Hansschlegelia quercus]
MGEVFAFIGFDPELFARYAPALLSGLWTTLSLVAISTPLGFALGIPIALARYQGGATTNALAVGFTGFFRGTPLLAQLFLLYYGAAEFNGALKSVGLWWLFRDAFTCAALVFTLNTAAYQAEILRGAMAAVPAGQTEAGMALGLGRAMINRLIVWPQAMRLALRPLGNELILMIKASSIASVITVVDLMGATKRAFSGSLSFELYLWAALIYLALVEIVRRVWNALERRWRIA